MPPIRVTGMGQVLVLNASYEPLNITSWRRAVVMMHKGKAESLERDATRLIRKDIMLPTVIRLRHYVRVPFRELPMTRRNVFYRDGYCCQYCGAKNNQLSIDHVVPRSRGGTDSWENVTTACLPCNVQKGNKTPQEALMPLLTIPRRPLNSLSFEAFRQIQAGYHREWEKYVTGF